MEADGTEGGNASALLGSHMNEAQTGHRILGPNLNIYLGHILCIRNPSKEIERCRGVNKQNIHVVNCR
jgi:hypothetical protein